MKTKVACPKCRAALKSARELAPGRHVTCPRCKSPFVVPGMEIAKGPPVMGVLVPPTSVRALPTVNGPASPAPLESEELTLESSRNRTTLILVLLGAFLVLGGGGLLIYFCFRADAKPTDEHAEEYFQLPDPEFKPLPPRPLIPLTKAEQQQVDTAVGRGLAFLKKAQTPEGTWPSSRPIEAAALAGMTLLECGIPANDPVIVKAAEYVRKNVPAMSNTYGISL
ncbi:MAG TPA: hypothetical protein VKE98_02705, partial [Gemmataceae bacterium]|nr:hypothetical protein [Gemmataceae bacterium]